MPLTCPNRILHNLPDADPRILHNNPKSSPVSHNPHRPTNNLFNLRGRAHSIHPHSLNFGSFGLFHDPLP